MGAAARPSAARDIRGAEGTIWPSGTGFRMFALIAW